MGDLYYKVDDDAERLLLVGASEDMHTYVSWQSLIEKLVDSGVLEVVEMQTCYDCGFQSTDDDDFIIINVEAMTAEYPGSDGELACRQCVPRGEYE